MRYLYTLMLMLAVPAFAAAPEEAGEETSICPHNLLIAPQTLAKPMPGYEVMPEGEEGVPTLKSVTFYDGHPSELASLVPDETEDGGTATWNFSPANSRRYWVACDYTNTNLRLIKALPKGAIGCTVSYRSEVTVQGLPDIRTVDCE